MAVAAEASMVRRSREVERDAADLCRHAWPPVSTQYAAVLRNAPSSQRARACPQALRDTPGQGTTPPENAVFVMAFFAGSSTGKKKTEIRISRQHPRTLGKKKRVKKTRKKRVKNALAVIGVKNAQITR